MLLCAPVGCNSSVLDHEAMASTVCFYVLIVKTYLYIVLSSSWLSWSYWKHELSPIDHDKATIVSMFPLYYFHQTIIIEMLRELKYLWPSALPAHFLVVSKHHQFNYLLWSRLIWIKEKDMFIYAKRHVNIIVANGRVITNKVQLYFQHG